MPLGAARAWPIPAEKVLDTPGGGRLHPGGSSGGYGNGSGHTVSHPGGLFLVIFSIISLVFRFLVSLGRGVNHIPVVGQLNQLLGLGVGVVKAAIEGYIAVLLLMLIVGLTKGSLDFLNYQVLEDTVLIRWIAGWPLPF